MEYKGILITAPPRVLRHQYSGRSARNKYDCFPFNKALDFPVEMEVREVLYFIKQSLWSTIIDSGALLTEQSN